MTEQELTVLEAKVHRYGNAATTYAKDVLRLVAEVRRLNRLVLPEIHEDPDAGPDPEPCI